MKMVQQIFPWQLFWFPRSEKHNTEEIKKNTCFICGLERKDFDNKNVTFEVNFSWPVKAKEPMLMSPTLTQDHVNKEHNMWNYLWFIVLIKVTTSYKSMIPQTTDSTLGERSNRVHRARELRSLNGEGKTIQYNEFCSSWFLPSSEPVPGLVPPLASHLSEGHRQQEMICQQIVIFCNTRWKMLMESRTSWKRFKARFQFDFYWCLHLYLCILIFWLLSQESSSLVEGSYLQTELDQHLY